MAIDKNKSRNKIIVIVLVAVIALGGFASLFSALSRPSAPQTVPATEIATPEASATPSEAPIEETATPAAEAPTVGTVTSGPTALSEADLALATSATAPLIAVGGTYIGLEGYELFDTLTVLRFESGEQAYFATNGGFFPSGGGIPANEMSRQLTGFGADLAADSPEAIEAEQILQNHLAEIG